MENKDKKEIKNVYTIENIFCGTRTASEVYKDVLEQVLQKDYDEVV